MVNRSRTNLTTSLIRQELYVVPELYCRYRRVLVRSFCVSIQSSNSLASPCYVRPSRCLRCPVARSLSSAAPACSGLRPTRSRPGSYETNAL
ncbi:hypothetical protein PSPO01_12615 [Paraphaeosphaeria sporulosa]